MPDTEHYTPDQMRDCIAMLLELIDQMCGTEMHTRGQSPDWFVAAAMMSCNIEDRKNEAIELVAAELSRMKSAPDAA
jgi:hypothetical protein